MANKSIAVKLDEKLVKDGIIEDKFIKDCEKVHIFLNKQVKKYDRALKDDDFSVGESDLRNWLNTLFKQGASREKLNTYLRCGLAHLCFDYIDIKNEKINTSDHLTRAFQSFKKRKFNKSYFKPSSK